VIRVIEGWLINILVPYLKKIQWRGRGKKRGLAKKIERVREEKEILQKLAKKLFCVEIWGRRGEK